MHQKILEKIALYLVICTKYKCISVRKACGIPQPLNMHLFICLLQCSYFSQYVCTAKLISKSHSISKYLKHRWVFFSVVIILSETTV